jgi:hypothetical protein
MDRRVRITLPEPVVRRLEAIAEDADEPVSRVAAQFVRQGLEELGTGGDGTPARRELFARRAAERRSPGERAPWLEPYGGDREWRSRMWGEIVALYGRYPTQLAGLKQGWWTRASHLEPLCALAYWRRLLDDASHDPCEELSFQLHIGDFGQRLTQEGGSVTQAWTPGAPPTEWV